MIDTPKIIKWIKIEDGAFFDGSPEQFTDSFLLDCTHANVQQVAREMGLNFEIKYGKAPVRRVRDEAEEG